MRIIGCLLLFFLMIACSDSTTLESPNSTEGKIDYPIDSEATPKASNQIAPKLRQQKKCEVTGEMMEENELWLKDQGQLICIVADSSTYDATYGMSHRIIEVYNTFTCELDLKLTLPVNLSPDFPYFLADINYNNDSKIVAIKAAKTIYCLDLTTKKMLPLLNPQFKTQRAVADSHSGTIIRLELWEDFLVGYAQDQGTFVFDLNPSAGPKPILPFAEFQLGENQFNSLFLLPSDNNKFQAILPTYDWDEEIFTIHPVFDKPLAISTDVQKSALDNQFLVLRTLAGKQALLVDLKARKERPLPPEFLEKSTKEILAWAKGQ